MPEEPKIPTAVAKKMINEIRTEMQKALNNSLKKLEKLLMSDRSTSPSIFFILEKEFARPLSPFEIEEVTTWIDVDHHSEELIKEAITQAFIMRKLNTRYISGILLNWKRNNVKTKDEAKAFSQSFRKNQKQHYSSTAGQSKSIEFPFYNWLEKDQNEKG